MSEKDKIFRTHVLINVLISWGGYFILLGLYLVFGPKYLGKQPLWLDVPLFFAFSFLTANIAKRVTPKIVIWIYKQDSN